MWFLPPDPKALDEQIRTQFEPLVKRARADLSKAISGNNSSSSSTFAVSGGSDVKGSSDENTDSLATWRDSPQGAVALVVLLDQFPRNIYRGTREAFASDALARNIAAQAIAKGFHRGPSPAQQQEQQQGLQQQGGSGTQESSSPSSSTTGATVPSMPRTPAEAIAQGLVTPLMRVALYLPLMHDESLISQIACVSLAENLHTNLGAEAREHGPECLAAKAVPIAQSCISFAERHRDAILRFGRFPGRNKAFGRKSTPAEEEMLSRHPEGF